MDKINPHIISMANKLLDYFLKKNYPEIRNVMVKESDFSEKTMDISISVDGTNEVRQLDIESDIHYLLQYLGTYYRYNLSFKVI